MNVQSKVAPTTNPKVLEFVEAAKELFKPDQVQWCDGSKEEYQALLKALVDGGTAMWLNEDASCPISSDDSTVTRASRSPSEIRCAAPSMSRSGRARKRIGK